MSTLLERLQDDLELRDLQPSTRRAYVRVVERFADFLAGGPDTATADDVRRYLLALRGAGRSPLELTNAS